MRCNNWSKYCHWINAIEFSAVSSAMKFEEWAKVQGYETFTFYDTDEQKVTFEPISDTVHKKVESLTYEIMIIYFSGHGIWKGTGNEIWLLSKATERHYKAITISASVPYCQGSGIPHIIFISDACRSLAEDRFLQKITGNIVMPNGNSKQKSNVDQFYSCEEGDSAYEIRTIFKHSLYNHRRKNNYRSKYTAPVTIFNRLS